MGLDPAQYAALAKDICESSAFDRDARVRTSISRSYYSLFLAVRSAIRAAEGRSTSGVSDHVDHGRLAAALYATHDHGLEGIAKNLETLYELRRTADYVLLPKPAHKDPCEKPSKARLLAKVVEADLRRIPSLDWILLAGKI